MHRSLSATEWEENRTLWIGERAYEVQVGWSRDHAHTLKTAQYFTQSSRKRRALARHSARERDVLGLFSPKSDGSPNWFVRRSVMAGSPLREKRLMARRYPVEPMWYHYRSRILRMESLRRYGLDGSTATKVGTGAQLHHRSRMERKASTREALLLYG